MRVRRLPGSQWTLLVIVASACALIAPTVSGGQATGRVKAKRVVLVRDAAILAVAAYRDYLVWARGPFSGRSGQPLPVLERRPGMTRPRKLAADSFPQFGLAAARDWVVFARRAGREIRLLAVRHDGRDRTLLARSLIAPIASRGDVVAWAEETGHLQRIVVRNMRTGRAWIAARMQACRHGRCYRIDAVTLATDGVVFDRGAIGSQPSFVVRRRFGSGRPSSVTVPKDPQPDLAPSSDGALYYALGHGWRRWDFGRRKPVAVKPRGRGWWILGYERGRMLLVSTSARCRPRIALQLGTQRPIPLPAPRSTPVSPHEFGRLCRVFGGFSWPTRRILAGWSVLPDLSLRTHTDVGINAVIDSLTVP